MAERLFCTESMLSSSARWRRYVLHCRLCNHILDTYAPSLLQRLFVPGSSARAKSKCIAELDDVYNAVLQKYGKEVSRGDLPPKEVFVEGLSKLSSLSELPRTDEATTIDDVKYWLAESVPRVTEPSDSPEKARPSTAFDDDRYLSREAKRKRASPKSCTEDAVTASKTCPLPSINTLV